LSDIGAASLRERATESRFAALRCTSSPRQNAICRWFRPASGKPAAASEWGSFSRNPAGFAPRLLRFAEVPAFCLDNPACLESARLAKVHVAFRLFRDNRAVDQSGGDRRLRVLAKPGEERSDTRSPDGACGDGCGFRCRRSGDSVRHSRVDRDSTRDPDCCVLVLLEASSRRLTID
jgi:hypothetical protein